MSKPSRKRRRRIRVGMCAYCGVYGEVTRDHVVPRCLFVDTAKSVIQVDACQPCNLNKSKGEDDLRDFLALSHSTTKHSSHKKLLEATMRSANWNRSPTARLARWTARPISLIERGSVLDLFIASHDPEPMNATIEYIAKGVFYKVFGARPVTQSETFLRYMGTFEADGAEALMQTLQALPNGLFCDEENVLQVYLWGFNEDTPEARTLFLSLTFLSAIHFIAYIGPTDRTLRLGAQGAGRSQSSHRTGR